MNPIKDLADFFINGFSVTSDTGVALAVVAAVITFAAIAATISFVAVALGYLIFGNKT